MEIHNDDCFNIFPKLKKQNIDMVIVDLPYGQTECKWDKKIDLDKMWIALKRICKKNCNLIFFCTTKYGNELINSNPKGFRYDLVWEKNCVVGFLNANNQPLRKHEMIYIFKCGSKKHIYNPQKTKAPPYIKKQNKNKKIEIYRNVTPSDNINKGDRFPTSIINFNNRTGIPKKSFHRTQKPLKLYEWLIKTYSNKEDLVIDFCMGSGTGYIACKNTNRRFIGIEKDKEIFDIAKKRING